MLNLLHPFTLILTILAPDDINPKWHYYPLDSPIRSIHLSLLPLLSFISTRCINHHVNPCKINRLYHHCPSYQPVLFTLCITVVMIHYNSTIFNVYYCHFHPFSLITLENANTLILSAWLTRYTQLSQVHPQAGCCWTPPGLAT